MASFQNKGGGLLSALKTRTLLLPLVAFAVGLLVTTFLVWSLYGLADERQESNFRRVAEDRLRLLDSELEAPFRPVMHVASVFRSAAGDVTPQAFESIVGTIPLARYPPLLSLQWIPRLSYAERMQQESTGDFPPITEGPGRLPARPRPEYFPIHYYHGYKEQARNLGYDLLSDATLGPVFRQAALTDFMTISPWYWEQGQIRFRAIRPVYRFESGGKVLVGFVSGVYHLTGLIENILAPLDGGSVELLIRNTSRALPGYILYSNGKANYQPTPARPLETPRILSEQVNLFRTQWVVTVVARPGAFPINYGPLLTVAVTGLLLSSLLALYLRKLLTSEAEVRHQVVQRTEALAESETRYRSLVETLPNGLLEVDYSGTIRYLNPSFSNTFGYAAGELQEHSIWDFFSRLDCPELARAIERKDKGECPREGLSACRFINKNGQVRDVELTWSHCCEQDQPGVRRLLLVVTDVTERNKAEALIRWQAHYDPLTRLPNRTLFLERLEHALIGAHRRRAILALLFIDLDNFKWVNDTLGHIAGDELLRQVAQRIGSSVRTSDTVAHLSGDEFTVLLEDVKTPHAAEQVAQSILSQLRLPFIIEGTEVFAPGSIGITEFPADGYSVQPLLRNADTAMYRAKAEGGNRYRFFTTSMNEAAIRRQSMERALHMALDRNELQLFYQPVIDATSGCTVSLEALLRWRSHDGALINPDSFMNLAEELGLIIPIGERVLKIICEQKRAWRQRGWGDITVSMNLSVRQCFEKEAMERLVAIIREANVAPNTLTMEVTESVVMRDKEECMKSLNSFKNLGVSLAIDDFGIGYSSLNYLRQLPVDTLKVDKIFVQGLTRVPSDMPLVKAILAMARALGKSVIAEGVESEEQAEFLRANHCRLQQGFLYSLPLPPEKLEQLLLVGKDHWRLCETLGRLNALD